MSVRIVRTIASTAALSSIPRAEDALSGSGRLPGSACELRKVGVRSERGRGAFTLRIVGAGELSLGSILRPIIQRRGAERPANHARQTELDLSGRGGSDATGR
jgi:hypothetical protein